MHLCPAVGRITREDKIDRYSLCLIWSGTAGNVRAVRLQSQRAVDQSERERGFEIRITKRLIIIAPTIYLRHLSNGRDDSGVIMIM